MTDDELRGEYEFYIYDDDDPTDPRFSFWMYFEDAGGMCLYDRPPEGAGMWLSPERDSDYTPTKPTDEFKEVLADLLGDGVDAGAVAELPAHEEYFFRVIHGTVDENPDGIPDPVWRWMHACAKEVR